MAEIRRFSSFRAYHDNNLNPTGTAPDNDLVDLDELVYDTRLVGRSVWNTRWMLIIPGATLNFDPDKGLDDFIANVSDIKLFFQTYGYSGN